MSNTHHAAPAALAWLLLLAVCDEPVNCALGSDDTDCEQACQSGLNLHLFAAACAFRDPPVAPPDDGDPSGGSLHATGHLDGTVIVPDGEALSETVERHRGEQPVVEWGHQVRPWVKGRALNNGVAVRLSPDGLLIAELGRPE